MSATAADKAFDVAIVGAGLAGSVAATMLARAGHAVAVVDPHAAYPDEFRCEKLDSGQMAILKKTGLAEAVRAAVDGAGHISALDDAPPGRHRFGLLPVGTVRGARRCPRARSAVALDAREHR